MLKLKNVKPEIRIIGWDDAPFASGGGRTLAVGVVCRGGCRMDGVMTTSIEVNGNDATAKLADAVNLSRHRDQARVIMLDGVTMGGFNVVNIKRLSSLTGMPVIAVIDRMPSMAGIRKAIMKFPDGNEKMKAIKAAGKVREMKIKRNDGSRGKMYYQASGTDAGTAVRLIRASAVFSDSPEPLRLAHLICAGFREVKT
jgi:hypothetical protein